MKSIKEKCGTSLGVKTKVKQNFELNMILVLPAKMI